MDSSDKNFLITVWSLHLLNINITAEVIFSEFNRLSQQNVRLTESNTAAQESVKVTFFPWSNVDPTSCKLQIIVSFRLQSYQEHLSRDRFDADIRLILVSVLGQRQAACSNLKFQVPESWVLEFERLLYFE